MVTSNFSLPNTVFHIFIFPLFLQILTVSLLKGFGFVFLDFIFRKLQFISKQRAATEFSKEISVELPQSPEEISTTLEENLNAAKKQFGNSSDFKIHRFRFGPDDRFSGALLYIDGLTDNATLTDAVLRPLSNWVPDEKSPSAGKPLIETLARTALYSGDVKTVMSFPELLSGCLSGDTAVLVDGCPAGLSVCAKGWEKRSVTEPQSETVVRGPREGFIENLRTNTALIRRKIKSDRLRTESLKVGEKTRTDICLMYLEGVASEKVINTVKYRISRLNVDSVLETGYLEQYIEDALFSPFSTIGYTEKPDVAAAHILEGRVAVVVDGTPFVLTAPMLFIENFQTAEDYYTRPLYASITRILRFIAFIITVFSPGLYVALTAFHQQIIPTTLLFTIAAAREGTPFPVFLETFIMVFAFEILYEGGIRMPRPVGQAISIVGALIMGNAAVSAGLVGAPVVITIAITAVSGFLVPTLNNSASLLRIMMLTLGALLGWYGLSMGFLWMLFHLGSLNSFGVPYFDGFALTTNLQDSFVRMPLWFMARRPMDIAHGDTTRRKFFIPPLRPYSDPDKDDAEDTDQ